MKYCNLLSSKPWQGIVQETDGLSRLDDTRDPFYNDIIVM